MSEAEKKEAFERLREAARSRQGKKRLNLEAARMLLEGKPVEEVEKATGLRMFDVEGMRGWLQSEAGKIWAVEKGLVHRPKECAVKRVYLDEAGREHVVTAQPCDDLNTLKLLGIVVESEDQAQDEVAELRRRIERARREEGEAKRKLEEHRRDRAEILALEAELGLLPRKRRLRAYDLI